MTPYGCQIFRFVPLTHPRVAHETIVRSLALGATPILDLEDSVGFGAPDFRNAKVAARAALEDLARRHATVALKIGVRVNDLESGEAEADAAALSRCRAAGFMPSILVPKIRRASDLAKWRQLLPFATTLIPILETQSALRHVPEIVPGTSHLVMGYFDLILDIGEWPPMPPNGEVFWSAAAPVLEAATRHGSMYVHPPFPELENDAGFLSAADRLRQQFADRFAMCVLTTRQEELLLGRREPATGGLSNLPAGPLERARFIASAFERRPRLERTCFAADGYFVSPHEYLLARRFLQEGAE